MTWHKDAGQKKPPCCGQKTWERVNLKVHSPLTLHKEETSLSATDISIVFSIQASISPLLIFTDRPVPVQQVSALPVSAGSLCHLMSVPLKCWRPVTLDISGVFITSKVQKNTHTHARTNAQRAPRCHGNPMRRRYDWMVEFWLSQCAAEPWFWLSQTWCHYYYYFWWLLSQLKYTAKHSVIQGEVALNWCLSFTFCYSWNNKGHKQP